MCVWGSMAFVIILTSFMMVYIYIIVNVHGNWFHDNGTMYGGRIIGNMYLPWDVDEYYFYGRINILNEDNSEARECDVSENASFENNSSEFLIDRKSSASLQSSASSGNGFKFKDIIPLDEELLINHIIKNNEISIDMCYVCADKFWLLPPGLESRLTQDKGGLCILNKYNMRLIRKLLPVKELILIRKNTYVICHAKCLIANVISNQTYSLDILSGKRYITDASGYVYLKSPHAQNTNLDDDFKFYMRGMLLRACALKESNSGGSVKRLLSMYANKTFKELLFDIFYWKGLTEDMLEYLCDLITDNDNREWLKKELRSKIEMKE